MGVQLFEGSAQRGLPMSGQGRAVEVAADRSQAFIGCGLELFLGEQLLGILGQQPVHQQQVEVDRSAEQLIEQDEDVGDRIGFEFVDNLVEGAQPAGQSFEHAVAQAEAQAEVGVQQGVGAEEVGQFEDVLGVEDGHVVDQFVGRDVGAGAQVAFDVAAVDVAGGLAAEEVRLVLDVALFEGDQAVFLVLGVFEEGELVGFAVLSAVAAAVDDEGDEDDDEGGRRGDGPDALRCLPPFGHE